MRSLRSISSVHSTQPILRRTHSPSTSAAVEPSPMTTSGKPTPPRFKRSSPKKKSQLRSRWLAPGETEGAGSSALARAPPPSSMEVDAVPRALPREFFEVDALELAPRLLGKFLRRDEVVLRITEVEAYRPNDSACHGRFGITARTAPVFGPGGHAYVYLCYGLHMMLNVVADMEGVGAAVLIRSCSPVSGLKTIQQRRGQLTEKPVLLTGPGKVGWRCWMGQSQRAFWLAPVLASTTHLLSMWLRHGGSPLPALHGSAPQEIPLGHAKEGRPEIARESIRN
ncbi:hypothetical protein BS78_04G293400 [Paspalum vaginatum]|nr:hypothetical protein BS78_04G293400 [Paspalum vaginatum]